MVLLVFLMIVLIPIIYTFQDCYHKLNTDDSLCSIKVFKKWYSEFGWSYTIYKYYLASILHLFYTATERYRNFHNISSMNITDNLFK